MTKDISIYENGNGAELEVLNNDIVFVETLYNQVYIALFGGNLEASTTNNESETEQRLDWWGNTLFYSGIASKQFNSNTERVLNDVVLNSAGRLSIIRAVESDLQYLRNVVNVSVDVIIQTKNKVEIIVNFTEKENQQEQQFQLIYDNAKNEVITEQTI